MTFWPPKHVMYGFSHITNPTQHLDFNFDSRRYENLQLGFHAYKVCHISLLMIASMLKLCLHPLIWNIFSPTESWKKWFENQLKYEQVMVYGSCISSLEVFNWSYSIKISTINQFSKENVQVKSKEEPLKKLTILTFFGYH